MMQANTYLKAFLELGFQQSKHDPCLLLHSDMMVVLCVDDAGISTKSKKEIDDLTEALKSKGFKLAKEGSFTAFLGVKFEHCNDGSVKLNQSGLINKIPEATSMINCNLNRLLTLFQALGSMSEKLKMKVFLLFG